MYRILVLVSVFLCVFWKRIHAQENDFRVNKGWEQERHMWKAAWVTHPTESVFDFNVFAFVNRFHLDKVPDSLIVYLSADTRYKLYVNGDFVGIGPAKGNPTNWRYEKRNLAAHLKRGSNVVAVEVYNQGEYKPAALYSQQTAFIFQAEGSLGAQLNTGSGNWVVRKNTAYKPKNAFSEGRNKARHYYVSGACDSIMASQYPWGWKTGEINDQHWLLPKVVETGAGRGFRHGALWWLIPRNIPLLRYGRDENLAIVRTNQTGIKVGSQLNPGNKVIIPAHSKTSILLDKGYLTKGFPRIEVSGGRNGVVEITYSEALYTADGKKGNRNDISGKSIDGYSDVIVPDGSANRAFEPLWYRVFRYVQIDVVTQDDPLVIHDFYSISLEYPFDENGAFDGGDDTVDEIWDVGWRTAKLCADETYMDTPYWEQLQYLGDSRIQALVSLYVSGDDRLMKNLIKSGNDSRMPNGLTLSREPSRVPQVIPTFSLYWVSILHDYFMHRPDKAFVKANLHGVDEVLGWFEKRLSANGMLGGLDWFNFVDWAEGFDTGCPDGVDLGHSALLSLTYAYALEQAAEMHAHLGSAYHSNHYKKLATSIKDAVLKFCYDEQRGLLADTPDKTVFSQHTNIFGILTGVFDGDTRKKVMTKVLEDKRLVQTTIYFKFYLMQALYESGMAGEYMDNLGPWKAMLDEGLTTWEEGDLGERSDCHAWGSSPNYDLLATVAGVRPGSPSFGTVKISPSFGQLNYIRAKIPHPEGMIIVDLTKDALGEPSGTIELPEGVSGVFFWGDKTIPLKNNTLINLSQ